MPLQDREDMPKLNDRQGQIPPIQGVENTAIKGLTFDAAGTLIELVEPIGESYSRVAEKFGITASPDAINSAFRSAWKKIPSAFSLDCPITGLEGTGTEKEWWSAMVHAVFQESRAVGLSSTNFPDFFEALYDHFERPGTWRLLDGAPEVVSFASSKFPCAILSNFDDRLRRVLRGLDLLEPFDHVILSSEIRASKPDPVMFAEAATRLKTPAQNILHIGDDPRADWEGGRAARFQIFRVGKGQRNLRDLFAQLSLAD